jgi:iron complex outermembrane receptor protein
MITATLRRDGSSKFGADHKWGIFPSASAAWGISQEAFMEDVKWVSDLKLRAGWGVTGNQDGLTPYKSLELYQASGTYFNNGAFLTAFAVSQNANPDLKWEETSMFNVGLDFQLFKGRLNGTIEYYSKQTKDMLYNYSVPTPTYVYGTIAANVGDMSNKGIEVALNFDAIRTKNFRWTTALNLSHNKNKITKLSNDLYSTDRVYVGDPWIRGASGVTSHVVEEGYPVGQFFMLKCNGISEDGKFILEDLNKDGQITDDDRTYCGDAQPDLTFGWNNTFSWKNWDASFFIRGTIGNKVLNNPVAAYGNNTYISGTNAMKNENLLKMSESSRVCSYYIEDASFARLDNMSIGYTFNTKNINWLQKARVYAAAQNLFVITGYKGLDPEVEIFRGDASDSNAGLDPGIEPRNYFPKARSFTFGVNLTF